MPDDDVNSSRVFYHAGRDLAGVRALVLEIHILGADTDVRAGGGFHRCRNVDGRHTEYHVFGVCRARSAEQSDQLARL